MLSWNPLYRQITAHRRRIGRMLACPRLSAPPTGSRPALRSAPGGPGHVRVEAHAGGTARGRESVTEVRPLGRLVLEPADVRVLRRQFDRFGPAQDDVDRLFRLAHRRVARVELEAKIEVRLACICWTEFVLT